MDNFQNALKEEFLKVLEVAKNLEKETNLPLNLLLETLSTLNLSMEIDLLNEQIAHLIEGYTTPPGDEDLVDYV